MQVTAMPLFRNRNPRTKFVFFNAFSIVNKTHELAYLLDTEEPAVVAITETKLDDSIDDTSVMWNHKYVLLRKDRNRHGGGVALLLKKSISYVRLFEDSLIGESLFVDLISDDDEVVRIGVCYRTQNQAALENIKHDITLANDEGHTCIVVGDFNLPSVSWPTLTGTERSHVDFATYLCGLGFEQHVMDPTRYNPPNILDLVLCNEYNVVYNVDVGAKFASSDHCAISFVFSFCEGEEVQIPRRKYVGADYNQINELLASVNWQNLFWGNISPDTLPVKSFWDRFTDIITYSPKAN